MSRFASFVMDDVLVKASALLRLVPDGRALLKSGASETDLALIRRHQRTGRPLGDAGFLKRLEKRLGLALRCLKPRQKRN